MAPRPVLDVDAYFSRLGFSGKGAADLETLRRLHVLHPASIPFENLSPLLGRGVALDSAALQDKLLRQGRGGYCYEHNLLFAEVLRALGFEVTGLAARVLWNLPESAVLPRTHMLLLVRLQGAAYVADVGFGGLTLTAPLRLQAGLVQETPHERFRLEQEQGLWVLQAEVADSWKPLYAFDLQEQLQEDYELANWYVSTHPNSRFVRELVAARPEAGCRHALLNRRYSRYERDGLAQTREVESPAELLELLAGPFGIRLDELTELEGRLGRFFS